MALAALSTGSMVGLSLVAGVFIIFSLVVSMVIPRYRPDFPGQKNVRLFVAATLVFFVGTLAAVEGFAKEVEQPAGDVDPGRVLTTGPKGGVGGNPGEERIQTGATATTTGG